MWISVQPERLFPFFFVVLSGLLCLSCTASRILLVSLQFRSHIQGQFVLGQELVARGHDVFTILNERLDLEETATAKGIKILTYHIPPEAHFSSKQIVGMASKATFKRARKEERSHFGFNISLADCKYILEDEVLVTELRQMKFDLAIADGFVLMPCFMLVPVYLGIPFIVMSSTLSSSWIGVPALPSFVPMRILELTDKMSFSERLTNTMSFLAFSDIKLLSKIKDFPALFDTALIKKYAPAYRDFIHLYSSAQMYIEINDHNLEFPAPSMPFVIRIPGITLCPAKPLDDKIKTVADKATDGLILMSFGTGHMTHPENMILKFLEAYGNMKQTIVWKIPDFPNHLEIYVSSNVIILPWLPQNDLLGHPNTKVFITHCGNNGQYEAVYHGVPMIGFPLFGDQPHNAQRMVSRGYGIRMNILTFESSELQKNILQLMNNASIKEKVGKAGRILKSRIMLPKEEAAYWVEHVLEFGSDHLGSLVQTMPMYKLYMLDAIAFILGCATILVALIVCTGKCLWERVPARQAITKIDLVKKVD